MAPHRVRRTAQSLKRDIGRRQPTASRFTNVADVTQDHAQTRALRTIVLSVFRGAAFYFATTKARSVSSARFAALGRLLRSHTPLEIRAAVQTHTILEETIGGLRPATCRIVFGLLAASELRISEATQLRRDDVDLGAGVLTIREGKFHMSRLVPLHSTVTAALKAYADLRNRKVALPNDNHFFLLDNGSHATSRGMRYALRILCGQLGWQPRGDHAHHRLHDLRHGFIVRSTLRTMKQGGASDRDVLALSTYVGHVHISDTDLAPI